MKQSWIALSSAVCLAAGLFMYLFFRSPELLMFHWLRSFGLYEGVMEMRKGISISIWPWMYESLPYGLWNLSLGMALWMIWRNKMVVLIKWGILLLTFFSGVFVELMQGVSVIRGTFDRLDLVVLTFSFLMVYFITSKTPIHEKAIC